MDQPGPPTFCSPVSPWLPSNHFLRTPLIVTGANRRQARLSDTLGSDMTDIRCHPSRSDALLTRGGTLSTASVSIRRRMSAGPRVQLVLVVPVVVLVATQESPIVRPSEGFGDTSQDAPVGFLLLRERALFSEGDFPLPHDRVPCRPQFTLGEAPLEGGDGFLECLCSPCRLLLLTLCDGHHGGDPLLDQLEVCLVRLKLLFGDLESFRIEGRLFLARLDLSFEIPRLSPIQEVGEDRNAQGSRGSDHGRDDPDDLEFSRHERLIH